MKPMAVIFAMVTSLIAPPSMAATTTEQSLKVTGTYVYPDFGGGDVAIKYAGTIAGCDDGFWLSPAQAGFKQSYAQLLAAVAGGRNVYLSGDTAQLWAGSGGKYCKVVYVHVEW